MFLIFLKVFYYFFVLNYFFEKQILKIKKILFSYILNFKKEKLINYKPDVVLRVFGGVVAVVFQSIFHSEKHANNIFLFLKNYF
jgi:UDP-N-acetylglucosamine:LPS N-acetylglucosamine transferase